MTSDMRRYITAETAIGAVINGVLSLAFVELLFHGQARVPVHGSHGLILDAVPQSVMIAVMSTIVPTLLTRNRVGRGAVQTPASRARMSARSRIARAVRLAVVGALAGIALSAALLVSGPADWPMCTVMIGKVIYGAILGGAISALATRAALAG